jgi:membrane fusion protein, multidrug efflux system
MRKGLRIAMTTALLTVVAVSIAGYLLHGFPEARPPAEAPEPSVPISSAPVQQGDLSLWLAGLGTAQAYNTVTVKPRVSGQIVEIRFTEGELVHRGDVLAQIDPLPFAAQLRLAQAAMAKDEVQLTNARADLTRFAALSPKGFVTSQSVDTQRAQVATFQAAVRADQATIDAAQVQLNYATIRTPIDGITGIRMVDVGNVISPGDAGIVVITQIEPTSVVFSLPEDEIVRMAIGRPGGVVPVSIYSRDDRTKLAECTLALVDNQIDQSTGTARLKAICPNKDHALKPGQFLNAHMLAASLKNAVTIPADAVQQDDLGTWVYTISRDSKAEPRRISTGSSSGGKIVVESGLAPGERVVTDGQYSLRPGSTVIEQPQSDVPQGNAGQSAQLP